MEHWIERRFPGRHSNVPPLVDALAAAKALAEIRRRQRELPAASARN